MAEWLERAVNLFVGALVLVLLVKYREDLVAADESRSQRRQGMAKR